MVSVAPDKPLSAWIVDTASGATPGSELNPFFAEATR
jgi:hypothetical protein